MLKKKSESSKKIVKNISNEWKVWMVTSIYVRLLAATKKKNKKKVAADWHVQVAPCLPPLALPAALPSASCRTLGHEVDCGATAPAATWQGYSAGWQIQEKQTAKKIKHLKLVVHVVNIILVVHHVITSSV